MCGWYVSVRCRSVGCGNKIRMYEDSRTEEKQRKSIREEEKERKKERRKRRDWRLGRDARVRARDARVTWGSCNIAVSG